MKIAVVGATGLVGREMLKVLEEEGISFEKLIPVASKASEGKLLTWKGEDIEVVTVEAGLAMRPDVALFSAGSDISLEWAPQFTAEGCYVIDNSSAWRMDPGIPLVVPEINGAMLERNDLLIANPNCSTIQMVMALAPLHREFVARRIVVSTYQSVTGSGLGAVRQLEGERSGKEVKRKYPHEIDMNLIPEAGSFTDNGYTTEEIKLEKETAKIMDDANIRVTATAVRVPVVGGHSESVNIEFMKPFKVSEVRRLLEDFPGVSVQDDPTGHIYPMPLTAKGRNEVFVGRIRRDHSTENGLNLWVVSDNLRKGAASNAVQIAALLMRKGFLKNEGI